MKCASVVHLAGPAQISVLSDNISFNTYTISPEWIMFALISVLHERVFLLS